MQYRRGHSRDFIKSTCRALACAALVWAAVPVAYAQAAAAWGIPDLMRVLSQQTTSRATFVERKYLSVVDQPLEAKGDLFYQAPDRFEKRTTHPRKEALLLSGDDLVVERQGKRPMRLSLTSYPEVGVFVQSIRGTLAGDLASLQQFYQVDLSGNADRWKLLLVPQQTRMKNIISRIRIEGEQSHVGFIAFDQADGDRTEMTITPIKP